MNRKELATPVQTNWRGVLVFCTGHPDLLDLPMTAFFASRQCPGTAIRAAMDWALQQAKLKAVVITGFHSPLEQSVLKVLIQASSPVLTVLAHSVVGANLPFDWAELITQGKSWPW